MADTKELTALLSGEPVKQDPATAPTKRVARKVEHKHPKSDHLVLYARECPACQAADELRRDADHGVVAEEDLARTLFIIPDFSPDGEVCDGYIKRRYNGKASHVLSTIKWPLLMSLTTFQVVVVRREPKPGEQLKSHFSEIQTEVAHIKKLVRVRHESLYSEVLESAPIQIADLTEEVTLSLSAKSELNVTPLIQALQDIVGPEKRIMLHNSPDITFCFTQV